MDCLVRDCTQRVPKQFFGLILVQQSRLLFILDLYDSVVLHGEITTNNSEICIHNRLAVRVRNDFDILIINIQASLKRDKKYEVIKTINIQASLKRV